MKLGAEIFLIFNQHSLKLIIEYVVKVHFLECLLI